MSSSSQSTGKTGREGRRLERHNADDSDRKADKGHKAKETLNTDSKPISEKKSHRHQRRNESRGGSDSESIASTSGQVKVRKSAPPAPIPNDLAKRMARGLQSTSQSSGKSTITGNNKSTAAPTPEDKKVEVAKKPNNDKWKKGFAGLYSDDEKKTEKKECTICVENYPASKMHQLKCCQTFWCTSCTKAMFDQYLKDPQYQPACWHKKLDFALLATTIFKDPKYRNWVADVKAKIEYYNATDILHCATPDCGQWIKDKHKHKTGKVYGTCQKCKKRTCDACKSMWIEGHGLVKCHNSGEKELEDTGEVSKRCYHCGKTNVKAPGGCNKVACTCGRTTCFGCGKKAGSCICGGS